MLLVVNVVAQVAFIYILIDPTSNLTTPNVDGGTVDQASEGKYIEWALQASGAHSGGSFSLRPVLLLFEHLKLLPNGRNKGDTHRVAEATHEHKAVLA